MIAVVLVNYFRKKLTKFCIESLEKTIPKDELKLVVVDNNSPDDSKAMILDLFDRGVVSGYVFNKFNAGEGVAINQGMHLISEKYSECEFFLWVVQDFFCMDGWYENALKVFTDLDVDFISCAFLEGSSNDKVSESDRLATAGGGKYSSLETRRKYPYDVGHAPMIRMKHLLDGSIKISEKTYEERFMSCQVEMYRAMQEKLGLKGVRLYKPSILMQDPEFNNPKYIPYYQFVHGREEITQMSKNLRFHMRMGHVHDPVEYYSGTSYKVSKWFAVGKDTIVDYGYNKVKNPSSNWG